MIKSSIPPFRALLNRSFDIACLFDRLKARTTWHKKERVDADWLAIVMVFMPLLMFLPLLALPIFWLLPLAEALPLYLCLVVISASMMWVMRKTMKMPSRTGAEYLIGREAKVVSRSGPEHNSQYLVRVDGELWSARSDYVLQAGERVTITEVRSNTLVVKHGGDARESQENADGVKN